MSKHLGLFLPTLSHVCSPGVIKVRQSVVQVSADCNEHLITQLLQDNVLSPGPEDLMLHRIS